jgi:uroporphyrinogen-III synthase
VKSRKAALEPAGIQLDPVVFYENRPTRPDALPSQPFERVLFTAGSTVRAYFEAFPDEKTADREWLAVGTSTLKALKELGLPAHLLP